MSTQPLQNVLTSKVVFYTKLYAKYFLCKHVSVMRLTSIPKNLALHDQLSPCCTYKHGAGKHCLQRWPPTIGPPHQSMQLHQEGKSKIAIYFPTPPNPAHNSSITAANIQAEQYFSHHAVGLDKITAAPILQLRLPTVSDHMHSDHSENGICAVSGRLSYRKQYIQPHTYKEKAALSIMHKNRKATVVS